MKINIGCGNKYLDGYKNIDISNKVKADEYYDICKGIKEKDNSIDEILAEGVLEQISSNEQFVFVLNECHRVLKTDGILIGQVPSTSLHVLCLDPFDRRWFLPDTFKYFDINEHCWKNFGKQYGFEPWQNIETQINEGGIINFKMTPFK